MSPETLALILTAVGAIAGAVKARAEAQKAKHEAARAEAEARRAEEAEKTTAAVIDGVERAKRTLGEQNLADYLSNEIRGVATERGVEDKLNGMVKARRATMRVDKDKLRETL